MGDMREVPVPDLGGVDDVTIAEVLVSSGDDVAVEDSLVVLESDKASMDVPSPFEGTIREVKVRVGDEVNEGAVLLVLEAGDAAAEEAPKAAAAALAPPEKAPAPDPEPPEQAPAPASPPPKPPPAAKPSPGGPIDEVAFAKAYASPAVRRLARELGVDLGKVRGTGRRGRIVKDDLRSFIKEALAAPQAGAASGLSLPEMPAIDFSKFGEVEEKPLSRIHKQSAKNLHRSWLHVPHVTQHDEADVTEMEAFRKAHDPQARAEGYKLTPVAFLLKASAAALKTFPRVNSSLTPDGENLIFKRYYHIGVAVDTPNGLVVPVVRDVDKKGLKQLAKEIIETSVRAREGKLTPADFQGASFTISSLGGIGGTAFTPIVNAPEVAILGASRSAMKPAWQDGGWVPRLMLPLSLSYDHRVIDGALAARFVVHLSGLLSDLRRLLL